MSRSFLNFSSSSCGRCMSFQRVALQDPSSELSELNGAAKQPIPSMEAPRHPKSNGECIANINDLGLEAKFSWIDLFGAKCEDK